ncbi:MAG: AP2 domain-containing protein [Phycisphaerales bacterium]
MKTPTCHTCVYAHWDLGLWARTLMSGFPCGPMCANHPDTPGQMRETPSGGVCRNYREKPPEPAAGLKRIPLGDGRYVYVDAADFEWLSRWKWHMRNGYAARNERGEMILMHRQMMQPPAGMIVDHVNRNKLDNSRINLRICTRGENTRNRAKPIGCSSRFKGVSYDRKTGKWKAGIRSSRKQIYLGIFDTEEEAARAYDAKAVELFGEFARLNFPEEWPAKRRARVRRRKNARKARTEGKGLRTGKSSKTPRVTGHRTRAATRGRSKRKSHDEGRRVRR